MHGTPTRKPHSGEENGPGDGAWPTRPRQRGARAGGDPTGAIERMSRGRREDCGDAARTPVRRARVHPGARRPHGRAGGRTRCGGPFGRPRTDPARRLPRTSAARSDGVGRRAGCTPIPGPRQGIGSCARAAGLHELLRGGAHGIADHRMVAGRGVRHVARCAREPSARSDRGGSHARTRGRARRRARRDIRRVHPHAALSACSAGGCAGGNGCRAPGAALTRRTSGPHHARATRRRA